MVMIENIHNGEYLEQSKVIRELNVTAIDHISRIYSRGVEEGVFRPGSIPSNCTGRSARSASSTSPTARPSRRFSAATSARRSSSSA